MPTTVESRKAMPEPSTVAATTQRPRPLESSSGSGAVLEGGGPPAGSVPWLTAGRCARTSGRCARHEHGARGRGLPSLQDVDGAGDDQDPDHEGDGRLGHHHELGPDLDRRHVGRAEGGGGGEGEVEVVDERGVPALRDVL